MLKEAMYCRFIKQSPLYHAESLSIGRGLRCAYLMLAVFGACFLGSQSAVRADEFSVVPQNSTLYGNLQSVEHNGWLGSTDGAVKTSVVETLRSASATRYELALQTARAIFVVKAHASDAEWVSLAPRATIQALHDLTQELNSELQKLGVDTSDAIRVLSRIRQQSNVAMPEVQSSARMTPPSATYNRTAALPVPARLTTGTVRASEVSLFNSSPETGVSIGLGRGFTFDATARRGNALSADHQSASGWSGLRLSPELRLKNSSGVGGGLNWSAGSSLKFSTRVESLSSEIDGRGTRVSGGVGLNGWDNRVSLAANVSRVKPENTEEAATVADVNLGVDVTNSLSLNLIYQKMFASPSEQRTDSVVAGGVSIKF